MRDAIDTAQPLTLLGDRSPQSFMRRYWQKKPLLVRQAMPGVQPPLSRDALFALAADEGVESRWVRHVEGSGAAGWSLQPGPHAPGSLPSPKEPGWTLLVQGVDLHDDAASALLDAFRFIPAARLDDLMVSWASPGGGVGPHFDSYDVFLLQVAGRRRWQVGRLRDPAVVDGLPLKILRHFEPEEEWLLEPGDMLYLPPEWAHDGIAEGECITCSIGFRAPAAGEFAREVLQRTLDAEDDETPAGALYHDSREQATSNPARIPDEMCEFAAKSIADLLDDRTALGCSLGEWLSEPKPHVFFEEGTPLKAGAQVQLDRRTRMLWDEAHAYINGESFRAGGLDATLIRRLADERRLSAADLGRLSAEARALLDGWAEAGWLYSTPRG